MNDRALERWTGGRDPSGPVTCAVCDCRLAEVHGMEDTAWRHFQLVPGQDARGCRPSCLEELHGRDGMTLGFRSLETLMAEGSPAPA
jgi:hypothetical protein